MQNEFCSDVSLNLWHKLIVIHFHSFIHSFIHFLPLRDYLSASWWWLMLKRDQQKNHSGRFFWKCMPRMSQTCLIVSFSSSFLTEGYMAQQYYRPHAGQRQKYKQLGKMYHTSGGNTEELWLWEETRRGQWKMQVSWENCEGWPVCLILPWGFCYLGTCGAVQDAVIVKMQDS